MAVHIYPHADVRMKQRGATAAEVIETVNKGKPIAAKEGRDGFQRDFHFGRRWRDRYYNSKQLKVYAAKQGDDWLVLTVIVLYF